MNRTHTPGPWHATGNYVEDEREQDIATAYGSGPETLANARLIAAAPEMLEALRQVADYFNQTRHGREWRDSDSVEPKMIAAAIAKAEGRTP